MLDFIKETGKAWTSACSTAAGVLGTVALTGTVRGVHVALAVLAFIGSWTATYASPPNADRP